MRTLKDSGIPWLGQIPEQWNICSFKRLVCIYNGSDYVQVQVDEGGFPVVGSGGEFARANSFLYDGEAIFIGRKGTIDKPFYLKGKFWAIDTVFYCVPQSIANGKYYYYQAMNFPYGRYITSTTRPSLTQTDLGNNLVILPPLPEQERIAEYLDGKCAEIDELISVEERMIAELQAYKQSIITETVTRGLNPDANNWREVKVGRIANYINGRAFEPSEWQSEGLPIVRIQNLSDPEAPFNYSPETYESKYLLRDGDLLFAWSASLDAFIWNRGKAWLNQHIFKVEPHDFVDKHFLYYELKFMLQDICNQTHGSGMVHITKKHFENLLVHLPPLPEQKAIAEYLDKKCEEIDALVEVKQRKIEELKEYKKSVIYEYVTGKREVS